MSETEAKAFPSWTFDKACPSMTWNSIVDHVSLSVVNVGESSLDADLVMLGVSGVAPEEGEDAVVALEGFVKIMDEGVLAGAVTELLQEQAKSFQNGSKLGASTPVLRVVNDNKAQRFCALGLGSPGAENKTAGYDLGKAVAAKCQECCNEKGLVTSAQVLLKEVKDVSMIRDFSTAFYSSLYQDNRFKGKDRERKVVESLKSLQICVEDNNVVDGTDAAVTAGQQMARGVIMAKDIVNAPHNVLNSECMADTATRIAAESGCLSCEILEKEQCEALGMGAYLGVARGSETKPQFIHLTYKPPSGEIKKRVGLVGKGLCFDTGGYNIKVQLMELMKGDCGGAAAVLGAARAVGALKPAGVEAHFFVAACENMINEKAYVPSDILTAMNGKTIEIANTDAEGRLTLADALCYADMQVKCERIIEFSTLTGACIVALGRATSGVWTEQEDMWKELEQAAATTTDKAWRMPILKEYNEQMESKFADIKNLGGRWGGAIHAALFLHNFVNAKTPFAHIDIAGPAWDDKAATATGYGAKLATEWITLQGK